MKTFYETMRTIMLEKDISAAELSRKTGLNQSYFAKMKSGVFGDPSWKKACAICDALEISVNDFYKRQLED